MTRNENGFDSLIGREDIKNFLSQQIISFCNNPLSFHKNFQNIIIYGNSGVGKTKVAKVVSNIYALSGILVRSNIKEVTKSDFTTAYINESSRLTRELLMTTLEGVLFIDEAYDLAPGNSDIFHSYDHGNEAITEMVNFLDKNIGLSVIIASGYEKEMETRFFSANEGMRRRFPHLFKLNDYNSKQLTELLIQFIVDSINIKIDKGEADILYTCIKLINEKDKKIFSLQAGAMLNISGVIVRVINSDIHNKELSKLLIEGLNIFLAQKSCDIRITE